MLQSIIQLSIRQYRQFHQTFSMLLIMRLMIAQFVKLEKTRKAVKDKTNLANTVRQIDHTSVP